MKPSIFVIFIFVVVLGPAYAKQCDDMLGVYQVIPFVAPPNLDAAVESELSSAPMGTPIFKVIEQQGKIWHIGLISNSMHEINLVDIDKAINYQGISFFNKTTTCFYELDEERSVIKVNFSSLNEHQLSHLKDLIVGSWGHIATPTKHKLAAHYKLDNQSLRKIKFFFIAQIRIIGVGGTINIIPLQKVSDDTTFTIAPISHPNPNIQ